MVWSEVFRKALTTKPILFAAMIGAVTPAAAASFDGAWNIQIASSNVACGNGTMVSIDISNGQVASMNGMITASGHVAEAGDIRVTVSNGLKRATGFGRLAGTSGSGTWRGALCSGTWTAQRI